MTLPTLAQSPRDPAFVQDPYPFYDRARTAGPLFLWQDYGLICSADHATVDAILRDRRFGREVPEDRRPEIPPYLAPFYRLEACSMLELEPPAHTRLRGLVMRAFTSRQVTALEPGIATLTHDLVDAFPGGPFDLIPAFCEPIPVRVIARLIGVDEGMADQFLAWSHAMVAMYQARRDAAVEHAAGRAAAEFTDFLSAEIARRRRAPGDDLLSQLIAARDQADRLSEDELIATTILLLNAGHEATVHALANGIRALLAAKVTPTEVNAASLTEEILRFDPPLHLFTRWAREPVTVAGHAFAPGDQVGLLLGAANRDPRVFADPHRFDAKRDARAQLALGAGLHFCVGAPLARAELRIALPILFARCPHLAPAEPPTVADRYHFHGYAALTVTT